MEFNLPGIGGREWLGKPNHEWTYDEIARGEHRRQLNDDLLNNRAPTAEEATDAQLNAGNYKKRHIKWNGLDISIENEKGSTRSGTCKGGTKWSVEMPSSYGYIKGTVGADQDHCDVYLNEPPVGEMVYIVDQVDPGTKKFDETKSMLGFPDKESAVETYKKGFSDGLGADRIGAVTEMTVEEFKDWVKSDDAKDALANAGNPHHDKDGKFTSGDGGKVHKKASMFDIIGGYFHGKQKTKEELEEEHDNMIVSGVYHDQKPFSKWKSAGGVVYNDKGEVSIRKVAGHYAGYDYSLPKGKIDDGESDEEAAHREILEESGHKGSIVADLGHHEGQSSSTHFFLVKHESSDPAKIDKETESVHWMKPSEAADKLDSPRDLRVLIRAMAEMHKIGALKNRSDIVLNELISNIDSDNTGGVGNPHHDASGHFASTGSPALPKTDYPTAHWPAHNTAAQSAAKKIALMEKLHKEGKHSELWTMTTAPKSIQPNIYQKGVYKAHMEILAKIGGVKPDIIPVKPEDDVDEKLPEGTVDTTNWKKIGEQKGSNPGGVFEDEKGNKWYVKFAKSDDHAKNEVVAAKLYEAAGSPVLDYHLAKLPDGKLGTATPWEQVADFTKSNPHNLKEAQAEFATHAWLGNWDAVGMGYDNQGWIIDKKTPDGLRLTTLDTGGAMKYRAQGNLKPFNENVPEWETLRNPNVAPQAGVVFSGMTSDQLRESAKKVNAVPDSKIEEVVNKYYGLYNPEGTGLIKTLKDRKQNIALKGGVTGGEEKKPELVTPAPDKSDKTLPLPDPAGFTQKKIHELALAGDIKLIKVFDLHKKANIDYKEKVLKFLGVRKQGEEAPVPAPIPVVKPTEPPPINKDYSAILPKPNENSITQKNLYAAAVIGDMDKVQSIHVILGSHVDYKKSIIDTLADAKGITKPSEIETPADTSIKTPPAIPPPPQINSQSNMSHQKKYDAIYAAAKTGDAMNVHNIFTNPNAKNTYSQAVHKYKQKVLEAMGAGGKVDPALNPAPPVLQKELLKPKIKESELPPDPQFVSSNVANVEQNKIAVALYKQKALEGDLDFLQSTPIHPSPKTQEYKQNLISLLEQSVPAPPPIPFTGDIKKLHESAKILSVNQGKKLAKFVVSGWPGVVKHNYGAGKLLSSSNLTNHTQSINSVLKKDEINVLTKYTGSYYGSLNPMFWSGEVTGDAKKAGNAIMKAGLTIPEGSLLLRHISIQSSSVLSSLKQHEGAVLIEPAIMSTSIKSSGVFDYRNVQLRIICGPNVKGIYVDDISSSSGEMEMLLPPNTRLLIQKVSNEGDKTIVDCFALPTVSEQCC